MYLNIFLMVLGMIMFWRLMLGITNNTNLTKKQIIA